MAHRNRAASQTADHEPVVRDGDGHAIEIALEAQAENDACAGASEMVQGPMDVKRI